MSREVVLMDIADDGQIEVNMQGFMILSRDYRNLLRVARAAKAALATNPKIIVGDHYVWAELQEALKEVEDLL